MLSTCYSYIWGSFKSNNRTTIKLVMCNADNQMQNIILAGDGVVICVQPVATMTELHINFR